MVDFVNVWLLKNKYVTVTENIKVWMTKLNHILKYGAYCHGHGMYYVFPLPSLTFGTVSS